MNWIFKNCITSKKRTLILMVLMIIIFVIFNFLIITLKLPRIDITENQLYSLTQASKQAIKDINDDVVVYTYGYEEDSPLIDLLKQYNKQNNKISYEILTNATNPAKIAEYELEEGYYIIIIESKGSHKLIDGSYQFNTYDYTTLKKLDITEQTITNAILSLTVEEKPKVYFLSGHGEYSIDNLNVIKRYLENEVYDIETLNLLSSEKIPDDCKILAIMTPTSDITEGEADMIKNYIENGGNIIFYRDVELRNKTYPILQTVLDLYGITMIDGAVLETEAGNMMSSEHPNIIFPKMSSTHEITKYLYSANGYILMMYAGRIEIADSEKLASLGVTNDNFITSSSSSVFVKDLETLSIDKVEQKGNSIIGTVLTKTIESEDGNYKVSKLVAVANNYFISDYIEAVISKTYPLSYFGNNKDIFLNSVAYLTDRKDTLTIRKDTNITTYVANEKENRNVLLIIFGIPILIVICGIFVWYYRIKK